MELWWNPKQLATYLQDYFNFIGKLWLHLNQQKTDTKNKKHDQARFGPRIVKALHVRSSTLQYEARPCQLYL